MQLIPIRARDATLPAPGRRILVDGEKYHIHLRCVGNRTTHKGDAVTTVFLDAGHSPAAASLEPWIRSGPYREGKVARYCYWDRPGFAWSETAPSPLSAGMAVDALSEALTTAGEEGPWVMVAHGVGGIYARIFASRHAAQVQGILLIDTFPESMLPSLAGSTRGFGLWLRGVISPLGLEQIVSAVLKLRGREDRVFGRDAGRSGEALKARLQENLVAMSYTAREIASARSILSKDVPIAVVSSGVEVKRSKNWFQGQKALAALSKKGWAWKVVDGAGHEVWRNERGREVVEERLGRLLGVGAGRGVRWGGVI